jgi:hypothetical protein
VVGTAQSGEPFVAVAGAASYLFEEFDQQGVLTNGFFLNEKKFLHGIDGKPDSARLNTFRAALTRELADGHRTSIFIDF